MGHDVETLRAPCARPLGSDHRVDPRPVLGGRPVREPFATVDRRSHANSLMAAPAPSYDLVILLHASAEEDVRQKLAVDVDKLIQSEGTLLEGREWGVRALAYPIGDEATAEYRVYRFKGPASLLSEIDRQLKINDTVLRHRIIKLERNPVDLPDLREIDAQAVAAGAAVAAAESD